MDILSQINWTCIELPDKVRKKFKNFISFILSNKWNLSKGYEDRWVRFGPRWLNILNCLWSNSILRNEQFLQTIHILATMWVISSQQEVQKEQGITDRENFVYNQFVFIISPNSLCPLNPARNTYSIEFDGSHNVWFIWRDYDRIRRYGRSLGSLLDHGRSTWAKSLFKNCSLATS